MRKALHYIISTFFISFILLMLFITIIDSLQVIGFHIVQ
jgi:hypothetical protein